MAAELGTADEGLGMDLGTSGGNWLFKDQELLMGPVPARVLVDKLYAGEIGPDTPVADERDEAWTRLKDVPFFTVHIARAQARGRVLREKRAAEVQARRRRTTRVAILAAAAVILVIAVSGGTWWWVVHRSMAADHSKDLASLSITLSPPQIALSAGSHAQAGGGQLLDVNVAGGGAPEAPAHPAGRTRGRRPGRTRTRGGRHAAAPPHTPAAPAKGVAVEHSYDMKAINATVHRVEATLIPCVRNEVQRSGFKGKIPFEFVIKNDGHVGKLWIDNNDLRGSPLKACFQKKMAGWHFEPFNGERPSVSLSFNVGG